MQIEQVFLVLLLTCYCESSSFKAVIKRKILTESNDTSIFNDILESFAGYDTRPSLFSRNTHITTKKHITEIKTILSTLTPTSSFSLNPFSFFFNFSPSSPSLNTITSYILSKNLESNLPPAATAFRLSSGPTDAGASFVEGEEQRRAHPQSFMLENPNSPIQTLWVLTDSVYEKVDFIMDTGSFQLLMTSSRPLFTDNINKGFCIDPIPTAVQTFTQQRHAPAWLIMAAGGTTSCPPFFPENTVCLDCQYGSYGAVGVLGIDTILPVEEDGQSRDAIDLPKGLAAIATAEMLPAPLVVVLESNRGSLGSGILGLGDISTSKSKSSSSYLWWLGRRRQIDLSRLDQKTQTPDVPDADGLDEKIVDNFKKTSFMLELNRRSPSGLPHNVSFSLVDSSSSESPSADPELPGDVSFSVSKTQTGVSHMNKEVEEEAYLWEPLAMGHINWNSVQVSGVGVNGNAWRRHSAKRGDTFMLDSGTNFLLLPREDYRQVLFELLRDESVTIVCGLHQQKRQKSHGHGVSRGFLRALVDVFDDGFLFCVGEDNETTLSIALNNLKLTFPLSALELIETHFLDEVKRCGFIVPASSSYDVIVGYPGFKLFDVVFDYDRGRVGFRAGPLCSKDKRCWIEEIGTTTVGFENPFGFLSYLLFLIGVFVGSALGLAENKRAFKDEQRYANEGL